jgi:3D (Asp-Asp-Asp) domain-containing protein/cell wall-associated NlpC family hydrolase
MQTQTTEHEPEPEQQPVKTEDQAHEDAAHDLGPEPEPHAKVAAMPAAKSEATVKAASSRGRALGTFLLTHYTFALESDPVHNGSPKISAPGLPAGKKYKKSFLASPYGIKMQGTGLAEDGQHIKYVGSNKYAYGVGGAGGAPAAWKTVAVDPHEIKLGTKLDIETYESKGIFEAKDTGGAIKGKHIDVFAGAIPIKQAYALGTKHSEVFLAEGGSAGGEKTAEPHPAEHKPPATHTASHPAPHLHKGYHAATSLADARSGKHSIRRGMEGEPVKFIQGKVHSAADGEFGPHTEAAVKSFQRAHHLEVDGEVGKHTMAAIDHKASSGGGAVAHEPAPPAHGSTPAHGTEAEVRNEVLAKAEKHMGARYSWAHAGPSTFDCSGFAWYVLHTDMKLTTAGRVTAAGLAHSPYTSSTGHPEKGDLVFYHGGSGISHVTIATGSGSKVIGASGGDQSTHGQNPKAKVKFTNWTGDRRSKSFGSIQKLIDHKLGKK